MTSLLRRKRKIYPRHLHHRRNQRSHESNYAERWVFLHPAKLGGNKGILGSVRESTSRPAWFSMAPSRQLPLPEAMLCPLPEHSPRTPTIVPMESPTRLAPQSPSRRACRSAPPSTVTGHWTLSPLAALVCSPPAASDLWSAILGIRPSFHSAEGKVAAHRWPIIATHRHALEQLPKIILLRFRTPRSKLRTPCLLLWCRQQAEPVSVFIGAYW